MYCQYDFEYRSHTTNQSLPIMAHRIQILKAIRENHVVIIEGTTGCGKTTQVR